MSMSNSLSQSTLDTSQADLVLLNQNLSRAKKTTDRLTTLLTNFDDRLHRLERGVVGVHKSTGGYTRAQRNIHATLSQIDIVLSHHDLVNREDPVIKRGPSASNIEPYKASIDRLITAKNKGSGKDEAVRMQKLIDIGAKKLSMVVITWVKDHTEPGVVNLPPTTINQINQLLTYLKKLPNYSQSIETEVQASYGTLRGENLTNSLDSFRNSKSDDLDFGKILDVMLAGFRTEYSLLRRVFPQGSSASLAPSYKNIIAPSLAIFAEFGQSENTRVKKNMTSNIHRAFNAYASMQGKVEEFEEWARAKALRKENELGDLIHSMRGTCLRSFPEFIESTKAYATKPTQNESSKPGGVANVTIHAIHFMKYICDHASASETFLQTIGDGSWGVVAEMRSLAFDGGNTLVSKYLSDLLSTLINALDTRQKQPSRTRPGPSAIFMLNNISYIRREIMNSSVSDWLGEECENELNRRNRSAKSTYLEVFSPLVACLMDEDIGAGGGGGVGGAIKAVTSGGASGEKRDVKDRFARFAEALDEIENIHRQARVDIAETETRERLSDEVKRMVIPTYQKFWTKHRRGEFSKNAGKYLRLDAEEVQRRMDQFFH